MNKINIALLSFGLFAASLFSSPSANAFGNPFLWSSEKCNKLCKDKSVCRDPKKSSVCRKKCRKSFNMDAMCRALTKEEIDQWVMGRQGEFSDLEKKLIEYINSQGGNVGSTIRQTMPSPNNYNAPPAHY